MHERDNVLERHAEPCFMCEDYLVEHLLDDLRLPQFPALTFTAELSKGPYVGEVLSQALRKLCEIVTKPQLGAEVGGHTSSFATFSSSV